MRLYGKRLLERDNGDMGFNSLAYAVFLPVVFGIYWILPDKWRWLVLLVASYFFYMNWNVKYSLLIFFVTAVTYTAALLLERTASAKRRKAVLFISLLVCLGLLFFFKYFNFVSESIFALLGMFSIPAQPITLSLLLPVGISFYTFQTASYVIDVYRGEVEAERHFGKYAVFVSFFPQLVAGPIERTSRLLPQIKGKHCFDYEQATYGMKLMAWGYFKKLAIADVLAVHVDKVFDAPRDFQGFAIVIAMVSFSIQIYCDFSGYSDIAIGTAKLFGIDLMKNFDSPYFASNVRGFWQRWHISLSTWFRDYVYIPLGGNRVSAFRHNLNLLITFLASGLWHGANWTFIAWGGIHGVAQVVENVFWRGKSESRVPKVMRIGLMFVFLTVAWSVFQAQSFGDEVWLLRHSVSGMRSPIAYLRSGFTSVEMGKVQLAKCAIGVMLLMIFDFVSLKQDVLEWIQFRPAVLRWSFYMGIIVLTLFLMPYTNHSEFIYFQF